MRFKPYKKKPDIKQRFSSGNRVEAFVVETEPNIYDGRFEWDYFPPSPEDVAEYKKLVVPRLGAVIARIKAQKN